MGEGEDRCLCFHLESSFQVAMLMLDLFKSWNKNKNTLIPTTKSLKGILILGDKSIGFTPHWRGYTGQEVAWDC